MTPLELELSDALAWLICQVDEANQNCKSRYWIELEQARAALAKARAAAAETTTHV